MPTLIEAIARNPNANAFRRVRRDGDDVRNWLFEPIFGDVLTDTDRDGFCVISAVNIVSKSDMRPCYMDISLPERINDFAYFVAEKELRYDYTHKFEGEIIPTIAIDGFGVYELFYSKMAPEVGIEVLKRGLAASTRKHFIAADAGYIFRDEGRYQEAAEMFQLAADEGVSSEFIYDELAQMYGKIGNRDQQQKYSQLFKRLMP